MHSLHIHPTLTIQSKTFYTVFMSSNVAHFIVLTPLVYKRSAQTQRTTRRYPFSTNNMLIKKQADNNWLPPARTQTYYSVCPPPIRRSMQTQQLSPRVLFCGPQQPTRLARTTQSPPPSTYSMCSPIIHKSTQHMYNRAAHMQQEPNSPQQQR